MKKLSLIAVILLVSIASGWFYLANKFEKIANEEILPKLQNENSIVSINEESIVVEKFKFKITLLDATILPESELFKIKTEAIALCYNPLSDKIKAHFIGDKMTIGENFYFSSPNHIIEFNRRLLTKQTEEFNISIKSENPTLYYAKDDSSVIGSKQLSLNISNAFDKDLYNTDLSLNIGSLKANFESGYFVEIAALFKEAFGDLFNNPDFYKQSKKIFNVDNTADYQLNYSVKFEKDIIQELMKNALEEDKLKEIISNILTSKTIYSLKVQEGVKTALTKYNSFLEFSNNGEEVIFKLINSNIQNYNEEQKKFVAKNGANLILNLIKIIKNKDDNKLVQNLAPSDLEKLVELSLDIKESKTQFDVKYNIATKDFEHHIRFALNDFDINFEGKGSSENKTYKGKFEISDPQALTDNISHLYLSGIKPILVKLNTAPNVLIINSYDKIAENIQVNGFDALAAFHENDKLKENGRLVSNVNFNFKNFQFNINDKNLLKIITDERVVKFLQAMPDTSKEADK